MTLESWGWAAQAALAGALVLLTLWALLPEIRRMLSQAHRDAISKAKRQTLPDAKRCTATTKAGSRCRSRAYRGGLCYAHAVQQERRGFP